MWKGDPKAPCARRRPCPEDVATEGKSSMREESGNRLAWFLTGLMIGAAAGLFAPKSGKETRRLSDR